MEAAISNLNSSEPGASQYTPYLYPRQMLTTIDIDWELQHTQCFTVQKTIISSPEDDEVSNAPTTTSTQRSPSPASSQMNAAAVQPVFENAEPLQHTQSFRIPETRDLQEEDTGPSEYISNPNPSVTGSTVSTPIFSVSSQAGSRDHPTFHRNVEANQLSCGFCLPENTHEILYFDRQGEQATTGMGSTLNIHDSHQLPLQGGRAMMGMESAFSNTQLPLQGGPAMMGTGNTFNIHDNPQLPLQGGPAMMGTGNTFNIHDNPQLPLQGGPAMIGMDSTFNNPQVSWAHGQKATGMGSSTNLSTEFQNPRLQIRSGTRVSAPLYQQSIFPGQTFTSPISAT